VVALEPFERVGPMLRAAERLAGVTGGNVRLMLIGDRRDELAWLEGEVRLLLGDNKEPALETVLAAHGDVVPVAEAVRRHRSGFVLAQYGGRLVSEGTSLRPLAAALECPLLLVR
jgi:hypothetical protein